MTYGQRSVACMKCKSRGPHRRPGFPLCLADDTGRSTDEHIRAGDCPLGRFAGEVIASLVGPKFSPEEQDVIRAIDLASQNDDGLGDTIHRYLQSVGADKAAELFERITGMSCGCDSRRKWLNKWWPYKPTRP